MALFGLKKEKNEKNETPAVKPVGSVKSDIKESETKAVKTTPKTKSKTGSGQMIAYKNLIHPLITEKTNILASLNQYAFSVNKNATKSSIKQAIKEVYNVNPIKVRIINNRGKQVRTGKNTNGYLKSLKKAIITIPAGTKIDVYES